MEATLGTEPLSAGSHPPDRRPGPQERAPSTLLLLTGRAEAAALAPSLARHNPACRIVPVADLGGIDSVLDEGDGTRARLVAFCTAVVVPPRILARIGCGAYNFHPGPPTYPGRFPSCWGSYEDARRFGATLHAMAARVDEGPIIAVEWFAVEPPVGQAALSDCAFAAAVDLFRRFAARLATAARLPADPAIAWSGVKRRLADYEAMCRVPPDIDATEFARRRRAFADLPGVRLSVELHGASFTRQAPERQGGS